MNALPFSLPAYVETILDRLQDNGYEAFVVGGCVRDTLRHTVPNDYDVTTNALPEDVCRVFSGFPVVPTGIAHGTVTVVSKGKPVEVTTYRVDGDYRDNRHPSSVTFTRNLRDDAARRDFTVNAMAWSPETGLCDFFGGERDLAAGILRAVGEPRRRFTEDALRILRALRFAAVLGFSIEKETEEALLELKELLRNISAERIRDEFLRLICGEFAVPVLRRYAPVVAVFLPSLSPTFGFDQHNPWHRYDVWEHTLRVMENVPATPALRLAALFHDAGKPATFRLDENGIGHFYGHAAKSAELAEEALASLRVDNRLREEVPALVKLHDTPPENNDTRIRRMLARTGEARFFALTELWRADSMAQSELALPRIETIDAIRARAREILAETPCLSLRDLSVGGQELMALGVPKGPEVGALLQKLLAAVVDGKLPNEKDVLLKEARNLYERDRT